MKLCDKQDGELKECPGVDILSDLLQSTYFPSSFLSAS